MHLLQPQPEVNTSLLVCTHSTHQNPLLPDVVQLSPWPSSKLESEQVDWLILHFNHWFSHHNVTLVRGEFEPEYFPANEHEPAKIQFAHGFSIVLFTKLAIGQLQVQNVAYYPI